MTEVRAGWSFRLPEGAQAPSSSDGKEFPASDSITIPAQSNTLSDVADSLDVLRDQLNKVTTSWRDAVGKTEEKLMQQSQAQIGVAKKQKAQADEDDDEEDEEEEEEDS